MIGATVSHPVTPNPWFEPRLTLDCLMTLTAAVIAYLAMRLQIRHADDGLQRQLDAEKHSRDNAANAHRRAVATALLFEIDDHYRSNVRHLLAFVEKRGEGSLPTVIKPTSSNPLPVYVGNASAPGELPSSLVEAVVHYYGVLQGYLGTLTLYSQGYDLMLRGDPTLGRAVVKSLIPRIKSEAKAITQLTYTTCGLLCSFVDTAFCFPRVAVANDPNVQNDARETLEVARKDLFSQLERK